MTRVAQRHYFSRSANLERDMMSGRLEAYVPTARARDLLGRIATGLESEAGSRAWSVTGPYGTGKSSFALFLDALMGPQESPAARSARLCLERTNDEIDARLRKWMTSMSVEKRGIC